MCQFTQLYSLDDTPFSFTPSVYHVLVPPLTKLWQHCECDGVAAVLNQVHNVLMVYVHDVDSIHSNDAITNMEAPTPLSRAVVYDTT